MADTPHPPFVPTATQQPRQLNRWLDINAQGGPLGRTQTFITLPAFNQAYTWLGYSDIVAAFNFEAPNNFSLRGYTPPAVLPNYTLCIMWHDAAGNVHRYSLWRNPNDVIFSTITPYTGQLIKKNFRFEVWSTNNSPAINAAPINFFTSVLGILDYRYGLDSVLVNSDGLINAFSANYVVPADVLPVATDWFNPSGIVDSTQWNPTTGTGVFSDIGTVNVVKNSTKGLQFIYAGYGQFILSDTNTTPHELYFTLLPTYTVGVQSKIVVIENDGITPLVVVTFLIINGVPQVQLISGTGGTVNCNCPGNDITGLHLNINGANATIFVFNSLGVQVGTCTIALLGASNIGEVQTQGTMTLFEFAHCNAVFNYQNHLQHNYGGWLMPITFPANSTPQNN